MQTIAPEDATILVIEDNPDNLMILLDLLQGECHVKKCAGRAAGWQVFKLLREQPEMKPDLLLLDLQIPGEDGYGVLKRVRETPSLRDVPVVAVTANVMPQEVRHARAAGFNGFIGKPINADRLPDQIRRILAGQAVWEPQW